MTELEQWDSVLDVKGTHGPAFPIRATENIVYTGMNLRDYFAAKAMQSLIAVYKDDKSIVSEYTQRAYEIADAMLKERLK